MTTARNVLLGNPSWPMLTPIQILKSGVACTPRNLKKLWAPVQYIIGHYNPLVRIIDLVPRSTYVACVNFIRKRRDLQFKVDS